MHSSEGRYSITASTRYLAIGMAYALAEVSASAWL